MSITQESIIVRVFAALWAVLRDGWQGSFWGRVFARMGLAIRHGVAGSRLCDFVWRDGALPKSWPNSLACRVLTAILNLPCTFAKWVYRMGKTFFDESIAFRLGSALGGASFVFVGLSVLLMLIVPHAIWNNAYTLLCMYGVIMLFLVGCASRPRWRLELDQLGPYYTIFMGFLVYGFIASLSSSLSMRFFIFYVIAFLLTLFTVSSVHKAQQLQLMVVIAVAGLVVASLYGCYQGIIGVPVVANQQDLALNVGMPGRIFSFFDNPNNFAEILVLLMPMLMALLLNAKTWRGRALAIASIVPCLASIGFTLSRSCWIGLAIAVVIFLVLLNWRLLPLFIVLGVAMLPFLPESIMNRILTIGNMNDTSTKYRFAIYENTGKLLQDYGIRGVGLGSDVMSKVFKVYPTMFDGNYPVHTHNNYLQMWGELGIFGVLSYLALALAQVKSGVKAFYSGTNREVKNILAAAVGSFCGILVIGMAEYTWFYPRNLFIWWFLFAIISTCIKLLKKKKA